MNIESENAWSSAVNAAGTVVLAIFYFYKLPVGNPTGTD